MCGDMCERNDEYNGRNFLTKDEKIEMLEKYKKWLNNESKGVEETMHKLKKIS